MNTVVGIAVLMSIALGLAWIFIDAKRRYESWKTASLWILGIIGLLIVFLPLYFIVRPPLPSATPCSSCGAYNYKKDRFCRRCGSQLPGMKDPQSQTLGKANRSEF